MAAKRKRGARRRVAKPAAARRRKPAATKRAGAKAGRKKPARRAPARAGRPARDLLGPPPREAMLMHDPREREAASRLRKYTETSPELSGGDPDADWERGASVGEEAVGGTVATPDQNVVDEIGRAVGLPQAPGEALRTSEEILAARDRDRSHQEG